MTRFIVKKKPSQPKREMISNTLQVESGIGLGSVIEWAKNLGVPIEEVYLHYDYYYDCSECYFVAKTPEPEERYQSRCDTYQEKLKKWKDWHKKNEDKIEAFKLTKKNKEAEKKLQEKIALEENLKLIQQKLKKLNEA